MASDERIIVFDSDEAAQPVTIQAWRASTGQLCFDEHTARLIGSTHRACPECGNPTRYAGLCEACQAKRAEAHYWTMPAAPWDGKQMVYSEAREEFYSSPEDAGEWEETEDLSVLRLVLCEPQYVRQLDSDDFEDDLPEDGEMPDELAEAVDAFNAATKGLILSWLPGKTRLLPDPDTTEGALDGD